jgi:hypothetical protein
MRPALAMLPGVMAPKTTVGVGVVFRLAQVTATPLAVLSVKLLTAELEMLIQPPGIAISVINAPFVFNITGLAELLIARKMGLL